LRARFLEWRLSRSTVVEVWTELIGATALRWIEEMSTSIWPLSDSKKLAHHLSSDLVNLLAEFEDFVIDLLVDLVELVRDRVNLLAEYEDFVIDLAGLDGKAAGGRRGERRGRRRRGCVKWLGRRGQQTVLPPRRPSLPLLLPLRLRLPLLLLLLPLLLLPLPLTVRHPLLPLVVA
jgi:hypothetical protein